jgi:hypothetical protein
MILLFRIISDEDPEFFRDLVIDGSDTFLDFHNTLQKDLGYDPSQLASFYITSEKWEKQLEITLIDMMQDKQFETLTMEEVTVGEYVTEVNQRMIYVFDFFSERSFFMELIETSDQISPRETPFVADSRGQAPPQLALDLLNDEPDDDSEDPDYLDIDLLDDTYYPGLDDLDPDDFNTDYPEES